MNKNLFILLGPSASGKTTVENKIIEEFNFGKIVQSTSRAIRATEKEAIDYYFRTVGECLRLNNVTEIHISKNWVYSLQEEEISQKFEKYDSLMYSCINSQPAIELQEYLESNKIANVHVILFNIEEETRLSLLRARGDSEDEIRDRLNREENLKLAYSNFNLEVTNLSTCFNEISNYIKNVVTS